MDHNCKEVKVVAWLLDRLYILDSSSFLKNILYSDQSCNNEEVFTNCNKPYVDLWQLRLGHASFDSLTHISRI